MDKSRFIRGNPNPVYNVLVHNYVQRSIYWGKGRVPLPDQPTHNPKFKGGPHQNSQKFKFLLQNFKKLNLKKFKICDRLDPYCREGDHLKKGPYLPCLPMYDVLVHNYV